MALTRLLIKDFRNIESCDLAFSSQFNFLVGANGSGKTSVLEAIYYLGHGRSFRIQLTNRVIRHQQPEFILHGKMNDTQQGEFPIGIRRARDGSTDVKLGGEKGQKIAQLAQVLPLQLITPEGFSLLTGGPKFRRAFVDWGVFHAEPRFYTIWSRIKRLNKQRNALLKSGTQYHQLKYWDDQLAPLAEQISVWRQEYVDTLRIKVLELCQAFLPEIELSLSFSRGWDKESQYKDYLQSGFERDQQLGYTFGGPHKSDLKIKVAGMPVEDVLSRGQLKLLVCALRLAQGLHLTEITGKQCIYLLDDFASELDSHKRELLASELKQIQAQVFVSCISSDHVSEMNIENSKMFHVEHGKIDQGFIKRE